VVSAARADLPARVRVRAAWAVQEGKASEVLAALEAPVVSLLALAALGSRVPCLAAVLAVVVVEAGPTVRRAGDY